MILLLLVFLLGNGSTSEANIIASSSGSPMGANATVASTKKVYSSLLKNLGQMIVKLGRYRTLTGNEELPFAAGHIIDAYKFVVFDTASARLNSLKFPFIVVPQLKRVSTDAEKQEYQDNLTEFNYIIVDAFTAIQQGSNQNPDPNTWSTFKSNGGSYRSAIKYVITNVYYEQNGLLGASYKSNSSDKLYREFEVIIKSIEGAKAQARNNGVIKSRPGKLDL